MGPVILRARGNEKLADASRRCGSLWVKHAGAASVSEAAKNNMVAISVVRAKLGIRSFVGKRTLPVGE